MLRRWLLSRFGRKRSNNNGHMRFSVERRRTSPGKIPTAGQVLRGWALAVVTAATLTGVVSCKSLPEPRETGARASAPVRLQHVRGPLSAKESEAILEKLGGRETALLQRHVAVEEAVAGAPLVLGNRVTLLQDGEATYQAMFAAIRAAKDHVNIETYIFEDDETGQRFADLLIQKQAAGVQVNLIYDSVGSMNTPAAFFDTLKEGGIRVLEFNPVNPLTAKKGWQLNQRDHRKLLVVDGRTAFVGGINISGVYSAGSAAAGFGEQGGELLPWRDTQMRIEGPVVADFQRLFIASWESQGGEALPRRNYFPKLEGRGGEIVRAIASSASDASSPIYVTLLSAINSAGISVYLTNAYFVPDPQLLDALKAAAGRGVEVKLILPSQTDFWAVFHAGRSFYTELLEAGVIIYERREVLLHSKTALVDGVWSSVGSTNLDWRSFLHNEELNAVVLGEDFSRQMMAAFEKDLAASERITLEAWKRRPLVMRVKEHFARMWQYWL
jgi:cardiolipin synthase A/B